MLSFHFMDFFSTHRLQVLLIVVDVVQIILLLPKLGILVIVDVGVEIIVGASLNILSFSEEEHSITKLSLLIVGSRLLLLLVVVFGIALLLLLELGAQGLELKILLEYHRY